VDIVESLSIPANRRQDLPIAEGMPEEPNTVPDTGSIQGLDDETLAKSESQPPASTWRVPFPEKVY